MSRIFTAEDAPENASNHSNTSTNDNNADADPSAIHKHKTSKPLVLNGSTSQTGGDQPADLQDQQKQKNGQLNDHAESAETFKVLSEKKLSKKKLSKNKDPNRRSRSLLQKRYFEIAKLYQPVNLDVQTSQRDIHDKNPAYIRTNTPQKLNSIKHKGKISNHEGSPAGPQMLGTIIFSPYQKMSKKIQDKLIIGPQSPPLLFSKMDNIDLAYNPSSNPQILKKIGPRQNLKGTKTPHRANITPDLSIGRIQLPTAHASAGELTSTPRKDEIEIGRVIKGVKRSTVERNNVKKTIHLPMIEKSKGLNQSNRETSTSPKELPRLKITRLDKQEKAHSFYTFNNSRRGSKLEAMDMSVNYDGKQVSNSLMPPSVGCFSNTNTQRSDNGGEQSFTAYANNLGFNLKTDNSISGDTLKMQMQEEQKLTEVTKQDQQPMDLKTRFLRKEQDRIGRNRNLSLGLPFGSHRSQDKDPKIQINISAQYKSSKDYMDSGGFSLFKKTANENANVSKEMPYLFDMQKVKAKVNNNGPRVRADSQGLTPEQRFEKLMKTNIEDKFSEIFRSLRSKQSKKRVKFSSELAV